MDIMGLLVPMLSSSPQFKTKLEAVFGQPVEHVSKCISQFMDGIKSGPGLVDKEALKQQRFMHVYQSGLRMGFQDWQAQIAAADCAGYPIIDVANSFAQRRGWECSVDEIKQLHSKIMPQFMEKGRLIGLFKPQDTKTTMPKGIPAVKMVQKSKEPPWRTGRVNSGVPPVMHNNNAGDEIK